MARRLVLLLSVWLGGMLLTAVALPLVRAEQESFVIIAHPSLELQRLSLSELRNVYLARTRTIGGRVVIPINYSAQSPWRRQFDRAVLNMGPEQVGRFWVDTRIRGGGHPPRSVPTPELMVRVVAALRGALGYVPAQQRLSDGVRVVGIEGGLPP